MFCRSPGRLGGYFADRLRYIRPREVKSSRKRKIPEKVAGMVSSSGMVFNIYNKIFVKY
jgi:hypothetical protein